MGAVLEHLPNTGNWSAEVRTESAYIYGGTLARKHPAGLAVPTESIPPFATVLDQILAHPFCREWLAERQPSDLWVPAESPRTGYRSLAGPLLAYGDNPGEWQHRAIELCYVDIRALRTALTA